jgi:hypothetical protein
MVFDSSGNLYIANFNGGTVVKITPNGSVSTFATGFTTPIGLAFDKSGDLFVSDPNATPRGIYEISSTGNRTLFYGGNLPDGNIFDPRGLAFDANGDLFAAVFSDSKVFEFAPNGTIISQIGIGTTSDWIAFAPSTGVQPTLTAVAETPSTGDLNAGKTVTITLSTNEAVMVTGTPTLTLNDNGTATYSSISADGKTLNFTYTVGSSDTNVASLAVTAINLPNGATIQDDGGNNLDLSLSAVPTYSGPQIDTSTPTVSSVTANPGSGTAFANQVVGITVSFSENVTVTGSPTLSLNDGGTATYLSGSGTNALVFGYSVLVGQYTPNLAVTAFNLPNGATVKDGAGNNANVNGAAVTFSGLQISGSVVDNWISTASANWTTVADWSGGVPNSNSDAVISKTGSYTVTVSKPETAHSLSLNDAGATVSDNNGGSLILAGGSGTLAITNGIFQLAGGSLQAGTISIDSGGTLLIAKGTYTGSQALSETITNNGSLTDNTTATITGNISGIGSLVIAGKGVLEVGGSVSDNVTFASGSTGTFKVDHSLTASFSGTIFGLTSKDKIDLTDLTYVPGQTKASYDPSTGKLTVTNGIQPAVVLKLSGNYTNATWVLSKDSTGGTIVVDPPANPSPPPSSSPGLDHMVALFNQFIAGGFPDHNGTPITNSLSQTVTNQEQFLAQPHHG